MSQRLTWQVQSDYTANACLDNECIIKLTVHYTAINVSDLLQGSAQGTVCL